MTKPTTPHLTTDTFAHDLASRITSLAHSASAWVNQTSPDLAQLEQYVLRALHDLAAHLGTGLAQLLIPQTPPPFAPCPCGASARFERLRPASTHTLLGPLTISRPYYLCASCHHGFAPLDHQLGWCAGRRSAALDELLALLGATQDSFAQAADVLARLSLVHVAPNTVRTATDELGQWLADEEETRCESLQHQPPPPSSSPVPASPLCISLDGVQAHLRPDGWKELCVGAVFEVERCRPSNDRRVDAMQAQAVTYVAELGSQREAFGWQLYAEAVRRGGTKRELVVVGDGAAWLWTLADLHFPQATCILDWFHATQYVWSAAAVYKGEHMEKEQATSAEMRKAWAEQQLSLLWESKVVEVIAEVQRHAGDGDAMEEAATYFTNQQDRMDYAIYRVRGLPIGSGTIESGCKQVASGRLKGPGMLWGAEGARQVVKVRAWLRSGRWEEAMVVRGKPRRRVRTKREEREVDQGEKVLQAECESPVVKTPAEVPVTSKLSPEMLAMVRDELRQKPEHHPWTRPWSRKQQCISSA